MQPPFWQIMREASLPTETTQISRRDNLSGSRSPKLSSHNSPEPTGSPSRQENQQQPSQISASLTSSDAGSEHPADVGAGADASPVANAEEDETIPTSDPISATKSSEVTEHEAQHQCEHGPKEQEQETTVDTSRTEEFEDASFRAREATRSAAEDHLSGAADDQDVQMGVNQQEPEPETDNPQPLVEAPWVSDATGAIKANTKNPFRKGDVLVVLDQEDLTKSCLLESSALQAISDAFKYLYLNSAYPIEVPCAEGLRVALLLFQESSTPELVSVALDQPLKSPTPAHHGSAADRVKERAAEKAKAKREATQSPRSSTQVTQDISSSDWAKSYDAFFRIVFRKRNHGLSRDDAKAAAPLIENIIAIAKSYDTLDTIKGTLVLLFQDYIQERTLWTAIMEEPLRWIKIAIALENRLLYDEAFKHLVGMSANSAKIRRRGQLPEAIQQKLLEKSKDLLDRQMKADKELMMMTICSVDTSSRRAPPQERPSRFANQHNRPTEYSTVNIFTDWVKEHIGHLDLERADLKAADRKDADDGYSDHEKAKIPDLDGVCTHDYGCNTVAGFYRAIHNGGDDYLASDAVCNNWSPRFLKESDVKVKNALQYLKDEASDIVTELVTSELQLAEKDELELDYLTCVEVGPQDVPWDDGCNDDEVDME